jgi:hypothetical protein
MHVSDTELIDRNTAFHQHSGSLWIPYDQEYVLRGGRLMDDGTGFFKREKSYAAAGVFGSRPHERLLNFIFCRQIIRDDDQVAAGK